MSLGLFESFESASLQFALCVLHVPGDVVFPASVRELAACCHAFWGSYSSGPVNPKYIPSSLSFFGLWCFITATLSPLSCSVVFCLFVLFFFFVCFITATETKLGEGLGSEAT